MSPQPMPDKFRNFPGYASPNFTPIPDQLLDEHLADLSGAELKVVLYICRRTFGFKRESDNISLNQMMDGITKKDGTQLDCGTGLSKSTLLKALKDLIDKNIVIAEQRTSADKGNEPTNYKLNIFSPPLGIKNDLGVSENYTPLGIKNDLGLGIKIAPPLGIKIAPTIYSSTTNSSTKDSDNNNNTPEAKIVHPPTTVVVALVSLGMTESVALELAARYDEALIQEKIEFVQFMLAEGRVDKPAGWLRKAIEQNYAKPDGFLSQAERAEQARQQQEWQKQQTREQYRLLEEQAQQAEQEQQRRAAALEAIRSQYGTTNEERALAEELHRILRAMQFEPLLLPAMQLLKRSEHSVLIGITDTNSFQRIARSDRIKIPIQRALAQITQQTLAVEFVLLATAA